MMNLSNRLTLTHLNSNLIYYTLCCFSLFLPFLLLAGMCTLFLCTDQLTVIHCHFYTVPFRGALTLCHVYMYTFYCYLCDMYLLNTSKCVKLQFLHIFSKYVNMFAHIYIFTHEGTT